MKINGALFSIVLAAFLFSCAKDTQKPNCATVLCYSQPLSIKIKFIDKNTRKSLLFAADLPYSAGDLQISSSRLTNYPPTARVDSIDNLGTGDFITLGDLPANRISVFTKALGEDCCAPYAVTTLQVNSETMCQPCHNLDKDVFIIEK